MAEIIRMPKMSDTMTEGVIAEWNIEEGEKVSSGDVIAEIETDKATMEFESYWDGVLLHVGVKKGDAVPIDGILAVIGEKGEDISGLLAGESNGSGEKKAAPESTEESKSEPTASTEKIDTSGIKATVVTMPKMSDTMKEGVIAEWHKKVGDTVASGDIVAEIETDKATMEFESYWDGVLLYRAVEAGSSVEIDGVLAVIGEKGADFEALIQAHKQNAGGAKAESKEEQKEAPKASSPAPAVATSASSASHSTASTAGSNGRIFASPLAKKIAEEKGISLEHVKGSGDNGRIIKKDIENFTPSAAVASSATVGAAVVGQESFTEEPFTQMRKAISRTLSASKFTAPHFYLKMEVDMDNAITARNAINETGDVKVSFNDMIIKAVASALRKHPHVNVDYIDDKIRYNNHIHIGVAVAVPDGLVVPVVKFADAKGLAQIGAEVKEMADKAKNKKLKPEEMTGGTFAVSNLGMFGIEDFTSIINPPNGCILSVGGIKQTPVVKNGQVIPGNIMKLSLSCDHRVVDGAVGSAFLQTLKSLLENPVRLLV